MNKNNILVNQTLYGYNNGHQLLEKSIELPLDAQQTMLRLSDLSGQNIKDTFKNYYTGYFLNDINKAVVSCTWYADEMKRPGCVWTHSLIFNIDDLLYASNNIMNVINSFHRPDKNDNYCYSDVLSIEINSNNSTIDYLDVNKMQYIIWAIWGNQLPVIIPNDNSKEYSTELLYIWFKYGRYLPSNFSFSTGSLSMRKINNKLFDLQIMPYDFITSNNNRNYNILLSLNGITSFPIWVRESANLLMSESYKKLEDFITLFNLENFKLEYFSIFIKLYIATNADNHYISIINGLKIIEKVFTKEDRQCFAEKCINIYINKNDKLIFEEDCSINILTYFFNSSWLELQNKHINDLVYFSYKESKNKIKDIIQLITKKEKHSKAEYVLQTYSELILSNEFIEITEMDLKVCCTLIAFRFEFALCTEIWKQSESYQREVLLSLNVNQKKDSDINKLISIILNNSIFDLTEDIYVLFGYKCVDAFWDALFSNNIVNIKTIAALKNICRKHQDVCIKKLQKSHDFKDNKNIIDVIDIISPEFQDIKIIDCDIWITYYNQLRKSILFDDNKLKVSWFYFILILIYDEKFPIDIVSYVFNIVHDSLANKKVPSKEWYQIEYLLPKVAFYNQWDRCKRIRKAIKQKGYKLKEIEKYDDEFEDYML